MKRRHALVGAGGALLVAMVACSKDERQQLSKPASVAPAPKAADSRQAFELASGGTGFVVGQAMAARNLLVFFDPQCPHCATLWVASKPLRERIRMVWMPVAFIAPTSAPQGALILAAKDSTSAMDLHETLLASGQGGLAVPGAADPDLLAKIKANTELWKSLDARSVPHLLYRIGEQGPYGTHSGGMTTAQLAQLLEL